jgi:hypothetical protein
MNLEPIDESKLLEHISKIKTDKDVSTIERLSMSEHQMRALSLTGTILDDLNMIGGYSASTLGGLACETGIPVENLYSVISKQGGTAETAVAACERLTKTLMSLEQLAAA